MFAFRGPSALVRFFSLRRGFAGPRKRESGLAPPAAPELEARIVAALKAPGRTEGVRKIAKRFGVDPSTVQRISGQDVSH